MSAKLKAAPRRSALLDMEDPLDELAGLSSILLDMTIASRDSFATDPSALRTCSRMADRIHKELTATWEKCRKLAREDGA